MLNASNLCLFQGYLGKDPEVRYTPSGNPVATISLATARRWKDKNGEKRTETTWARIEAWGKLAEICGQYLKKGSRISVACYYKTRKVDEKYYHSFVAQSMEMLSHKKVNGEEVEVSNEEIETETSVEPVF